MLFENKSSNKQTFTSLKINKHWTKHALNMLTLKTIPQIIINSIKQMFIFSVNFNKNITNSIKKRKQDEKKIN